MRKTWMTYVRSKNIINRIYDMLDYFDFVDIKFCDIRKLKSFIINNINDECFVETLIKYFECKLMNNRNKIELTCNLKELIGDLDYLKQYLERDIVKNSKNELK